MIVVLGVYAGVVFAFVSRSVVATRSTSSCAATSSGPPRWSTRAGRHDHVVRRRSRLRRRGQPWLQVWSRDGAAALSRTAIADAAAAARQAASWRHSADDRIVVGAATPTTRRIACVSRHRRRIVQPAGRHPGGAVRSADAAASCSDLALILVLGLPLGVATAGFGGYSLARRALAPVERMAERARTITAERLSDRLPVDNPDDELGRLATVFNETLGRLEASFEQMRRFTADVSHELRTPLTAIRSVGEVGLREPRDEPAYRAIIGSMLEEVDRLSGAGRSAADAVARRERAGEAVGRGRRSARAGRGRRRLSRRAGGGEAAVAHRRRGGQRRAVSAIGWCCGSR